MNNVSNRYFNKILIVLLLVLSLFLFSCKEEEDPITEINTDCTDALKLTSNYVGKSFIDDGIGLVRLNQNVDGDTAHFTDIKKSYYFTARFLQINTPESTGKIQAWGKAASVFTATILSNAYEIVCESEEVGKGALLDTTNKRYLAYIWYRNSADEDFRLLNLEIVEQCYSTYTNAGSVTKYSTSFEEADSKGYKLGKRTYGETDPNYDYSLTVNEITIAYLKEYFNDYDSGSILKITARVVRIVGDNLYLEDVDQTWNEETKEYDTAGIYMYSGYGSGLGRIKIGSIIEFKCKCTNNDTYGHQLTEPSSVTIKTVGDGTVTCREYSGETNIDLKSLEGFVIKIDQLKIVSVGSVSDAGAYTIYCTTLNNQSVNVRIDASSSPKLSYSLAKESIGKTFTIIGGVSQYVNYDNEKIFQVMVGNITGGGANDFAEYNQE